MTEVAAIDEKKDSVLAETHRRPGAIMGEQYGCVVPLSYGNSDLEYAIVRERGVGLIDISSRARINVSGSEAVQFLNGLITNDVKTLEEGMWVAAAFPNVQGRLLANVRVLHRSDGFLFDTEATTRDVVLKTLERFTLAGDFRVEELTDEIATVSVQGSRAQEIIEQVLGTDAAEVKRGFIVEADWNGHRVAVIRATHTAEDGFDLFVPSPKVHAMWEALCLAGAEPVGFEALEVLRIEAGIPLHGVDVDATNVVLEAGQDEAVSFTKGCYIGQEIIARIHWRGHVAKRLGGLILDEVGVVQKNDLLRSIDGKEIGRVTSTCFSPRHQRTVAMCMIKYDYLAPDTQAIVASENGEQPGRIVALPMVRGSWFEATIAPESVKDK